MPAFAIDVVLCDVEEFFAVVVHGLLDACFEVDVPEARLAA